MAAIIKPADSDIASRVPSRVWEHIFQHVSALQLLELRTICRGWRSAVDGCPALMERIQLRFPEGLALDREYEPGYLVPARNLVLEKVRISTVDSWWSAFGERIVDLRVDNCEVSLRTLLEILKSMVNLKNLQLENQFMLKSSRSEANFKLKNLEKFSISSNKGGLLDVLVPVFTQLKWISLPEQIDQQTFIKFIHTHKDTLECITIDYKTELLNDLLQLKHLTHLLMRTGNISNQEMTKISNALPNLKSIQIGIEQATTLSFLNTMNNLEELSLSGVSYNHQVDFGASKNIKLKSLKLINCFSPNLNLHKYFDNSPNIINISLNDCCFESRLILFATLEIYCRTLQRLELNSLYYRDSAAHDRLSEYFDGLKYLKIVWSRIPKQLLIKFITLCPQLEEIHLGYMDIVDDEVILTLSQKLKHLEKLTLYDCAITDSSVNHIVQHCHALKQLNIRNCRQLSKVAESKLRSLKNVRCFVGIS